MSQAAADPHGWALGRVGGIPIYLGRSWPVIALVVVLTFGPQLAGPLGGLGYLVAAAYALLLLLSVFVHEAGHALVAHRQGAQVHRIVANLWGGHTAYAHEGQRPGGQALVAVAGPAGNVLLAALGWVLSQALPTGVPGLLAWALWVSNAFVAVFNLLPGLPLDGGFLVHSLVWKLTGDRSTALVAAGWMGRVVTVAAVAWLVGEPLLAGERPSVVTLVWTGLIGAFLWQGASASIRAGRARRVVAALQVGLVLRPVVVVPLHASASRLADELVAGPAMAERAVAVDPVGMPVGWVDLVALAQVPEPRLPEVPVAALLVRPVPGWVVTAEPGDDATFVVSALAGHAEGETVKDAVLVRSRAGAVLGSVSFDDVEAALR